MKSGTVSISRSEQVPKQKTNEHPNPKEPGALRTQAAHQPQQKGSRCGIQRQGDASPSLVQWGSLQQLPLPWPLPGLLGGKEHDLKVHHGA